MAEDDIVQKVVIEVDDKELAKVGETAQTSFNQVEKAAGSAGQSLQGMQAAAGQVGSGAQKIGVGLADVTAKTVITTREMRSLGAVMRTVGEGAAASAAVGFVKIGATLGPIGIALFAAAEAFSYFKGKMKEAEEQAKQTVASMANIAKISAEMHLEKDGWTTAFTLIAGDSAAMKEAANNVGQVANQLKKIASGAREVISPMTSSDTLLKGLILNTEKLTGVRFDKLKGGTQEMNAALYQLQLVAAKTYEKMDLIQKSNLEEAMKKAKWPDDVIASIEKGSTAFKQAHVEAAKPFFTPEQQTSIDNLAKGWDAFAVASKKAWAQVAGDAETGTRGWAQTIAAALATGFADFMVYVGQFAHAVVDAFNAMLGPIKSVIDKIGGWLNGLWAAAKSLWSALTGGGGSVSPSEVEGHAAGGVVRGAPGVDANLAYLSAGEFVMRVAAVQRFGLPFMHSINAGLAPHFAAGGFNAGGMLPALASSSGGRPIHLHIDGRSFGPMTASEGVASALERFAVSSQIASAGRKQSWRR
jgi:hypothetical protein